MKTCPRMECAFPDCECQVDRISSNRFNVSRQYRIGLRRLLIQEIQKAAEKRETTDKRIAAQIGLTPEAFSRLIHRQGQTCSVDSLLLYLARLGVGVQIHFDDLDNLLEIQSANPDAHKTQECADRFKNRRACR